MEAESASAKANGRSGNPLAPDRDSRAAVILGNDALVAARPCTPAQLTHACHAAGFDCVVPPTWGDELVADAYLGHLADCTERVALGCTCPRVRALVDCATPMDRVCSVSVAAPPVAAARYLRATRGASLLITYVGDCPSASEREINARFTPSDFFASLERQGISIASQPSSVSEAESARWQRYHSLPGGLPALRWLARQPIDRLLREARPPIDVPHWESTSKSKVLLDLADAAACACGGNRAQIEDGEGERSVSPIVIAPVGLDLTPGGRLVVPESQPAPAATPPRGAGVSATVSRAAERSDATTRLALARTAWEPTRRRAVLAVVPVLVLAIAAALGGTAYAIASTAPSASADSTASQSPIAETAGTPGSVPTRDSAPVAASPDSRLNSATPTGQPRPRQATNARVDTAAPASDSGSSAQAGRRRRRVQVVPGWLPQGGSTWSPGDTGRLRRPPAPVPPPAKRNPTPRA